MAWQDLEVSWDTGPLVNGGARLKVILRLELDEPWFVELEAKITG